MLACVAHVALLPAFYLLRITDTVNTASRMESTGVPGAVHLSADTAALCGVPETLLEERVVEVKVCARLRRSPPVPLC